jgi:hypothetical protein
MAILVACHDDAATIRETLDSLRGESSVGSPLWTTA